MFKIICVVSCLLAGSLTEVSALTNKERGILFRIVAPSLIECGAEYSVSQSDLQASKAANSADAFAPCFVACVLRKHYFLNDSNKYTPEEGMAVLKKMAEKEVDFTAYDKISKICSKVNDETVSDVQPGCDRAKRVLQCAIESNVDLPL